MCVSPSVVCDRLITNRSGSGDPDLQRLAIVAWRGTGPRPTVRGFSPSVARGPVPRERWGARARTLARDKFSHRSRLLLVVSREPQTLNQAFALGISGEDVRYAGQLPGLMP